MAARQATGFEPAGVRGAGTVFIHFTMSLDGFIADAGGRLDWAFAFAGPSQAAVRKSPIRSGPCWLAGMATTSA